MLTNPQSELDQSIMIAAGSRDGVAVGDVVRTPRGLVGTVDRVSSSVARVTLLTDSDERVTATDVAAPDVDRHRPARERRATCSILDHVPKQNFVGVGDTIVTAGSLGAGRAAVDVPARHPDRHGLERERQRHQPVPEASS